MSGVTSVSSTTERIRVLHVDDEPEFGNLVATFLEQANDRLHVETATNASDGLARLADREFDCVVSDYDMPGQNGIDFLKAIRSNRPQLPFILYTGKGSEEIAGNAIRAGATDYLQKASGTDQYTILANRIVNVVERERAQTTMDEVQHLFSELANRANDVLWLFSRDWDELIFVTESYEDIFGQPREILQENSRAFLDATHPDDRDRVEQAMSELSEGQSMDLEFRVNEAEDYERYVWVKGDPITDADGAVTHVGGFTRDITDRKEHELELARAERQYEAMFEDPNILAGVLSPDGTVRDINQTAMEYIDADLSAILGKPFSETPWWGDDDALQGDVERWVQRAAAGEYVPFETEIVSSDGRRIVSGVFRPVTNEDGEVTELIVSDQDITDRRDHEYELDRVLDLLAKTERIADVGGWEIDTDTMEVFWTEHLFELLEVDYDEEPPLEEALDVYHEDDRPIVANAVETALSSGDPFDVEVRFRTPAGEIRWLRVQGVPTSEAGEVVTLRGAVQDITEQKVHERELERQNERLDEFTSVVSHDLKNPLNVAVGRVELAREACDSEHLDDVVRAHERMNALIDDLLTLAREGNQVRELEAVDLAELTQGCWQHVVTREATPVTDCDRSIQADQSRLQQLLENLIRNAVEHGGTAVTVTVGELDDGFYVEDDGPGVPEESREEVFDLGYSTAEDGTGFGLPIVKRVADAHGWDIRMVEGSGGGARVEITNVRSVN